jgi:polyhydroxybutyrate depolymerase
MPLEGPFTFVHENLVRSYWIHFPEPIPPKCAAILMLHGAGGTATWAAEETLWGPIADREGFAVVYPEGLPIDPRKPPKFLTNPQVWNDGSGRNPHLDDVGFLNRVVDRLLEDSRFDPSKIAVAGFSNGAGMTFRFAAETPHRLNAIAPVAGHLWVTPVAVRPLPTLFLIGEHDPLIPLEGGTAKTPWGVREGRPKVRDTVQKWIAAMGPDGASLVDFRILPGHGHHWPGGQGKMGERLGGPNVPGFDANRMIWDFVSRRGD